MNTVIEKLRNLVEDNIKPDGRDAFIYESIISSKIFTLTEANISSATIIVYKNGVVWSAIPITGSNVAWTRVGTVITVTKVAHGLITGDSITITVTSNVLALPLGTYIVTKLTDNTFTIIGLNAGATSGTCTYTGVTNYSYSILTGKLTITGTLVVGDSLEVTYSYYTKYSDNELAGFIKSAISHLSVEQYGTFKAGTDNIIFPTPTETEENLLAVVAFILAKGDVVQYRTPEFTITFERGDTKAIMIKKCVRQFQKAYGVLKYIDLGKTIVTEE
jgi:hypothetical protein